MNWLPDIFGRRKIRELQAKLRDEMSSHAFNCSYFRDKISSLELALQQKNFLPVPSSWASENVLELRAFLKTPTGQLLMQRARAMEYNRALANANDVMHAQHSAGVTVGINGTLNWIESLASDQLLQNLSGPTADQVGKTDTASGDHDDAALVEKFSP